MLKDGNFSNITSLKELDPKIVTLSKLLGVELDNRSPKDPNNGYMWDGNSIAVLDLSVSNILHEIAHWVICDELRRHLPDFGLGTGPDSIKHSFEYYGISSTLSVEEEEEASILGILFEKFLNYNWNKTFKRHDWVGYDDQVFKCINYLLKNNILTSCNYIYSSYNTDFNYPHIIFHVCPTIIYNNKEIFELGDL